MFVFGPMKKNPTQMRSLNFSLAVWIGGLGTLLAATLLLCASPASAETELTAPQKTELLTQMEQLRNKYPAIKSEFVEEKTTPLLNHPVITQGLIYFQYPNKFRRDITGKNPSTTVCNGKILWIYYPNFNEVEQYALGEHKVFDDSISAITAGLSFQQLEQNYQFRAWRDDKSIKLELIPKKPNIRRLVEVLTLWMTPDFMAYKSQAILPKGGMVQTRYSNSSRAPLPSSTFEFTPPAGATVTKPLGK